jgi:transposase
VLIDHTNERILDVLETRDKSALKRWLRQGAASGLARLSEHREQLRDLFEDRKIISPAIATLHLKRWCQDGRQLGLTALEPFYRTLENWMKKIANYFVNRSSNGRTEGFNRNLRCLLWRACGMRNFNHFRLLVLHALG